MCFIHILSVYVTRICIHVEEELLLESIRTVPTKVL